MIKCKQLEARFGGKGIVFGGPRSISAVLNSPAGMKVEIQQGQFRTVVVTAENEINANELYSVFSKLERLLMMFDGRFFPLSELKFTGSVESSDNQLLAYAHHCCASRLSYFESADFCLCTANKLVDFYNIFSADLYQRWEEILDELDIVHQMYLYSSCVSGQPVDIKCSFLIELVEPLVEIVKEQKHYFSSLTPGEKGPTLKNRLDALIAKFGEDVFGAEISADYNAFLQVLVNSRVRIMHIKRNQRGIYFDGLESVLYSAKMSLLYRKIIFVLLGIEPGEYQENLKKCIQYWDQWNDVLSKLLCKL